MKLLTKQNLADFKKTGSQEGTKDPLVIVKFFNPTGAGTWYATEYDPIDEIFYGYVSIFGDHCDEWGSFALSQLVEFKGQFGLGIERDMHTEIKPISEFNISTLTITK